MAIYFMCGIGGSGVSAIAQVLRARGHEVLGSDRAHDRGQNPRLYSSLEAQGIRLYPQDGSGVTPRVGAVVVSSAVEPTIPDVRAALDMDIPVVKRAEILAELLHEQRGIAVGGTSGKSTVTGMIGHILVTCGRAPTVIGGGVMLNAVGENLLGNAVMGEGATTVVETDESDGTISLFSPDVAVLTNVSLDHKPLPELRELFGGFCRRAKEVVVANADCAESMGVTACARERVTFGIASEADVRADEVDHRADGVTFRVNGIPARLSIPGRHNVANAAAAMAACRVEGLSLAESAHALESFTGIGRRLEVVGTSHGVTVIDDFAHNPDKITATLDALGVHEGRLVVVFQPHGFGPTRMLRAGLVDAFLKGMDAEDILVMSEIYYAGGTAQKDISSADLVDEIRAGGRNAIFRPTRDAVGRAVLDEVRSGDRVVVMGARDDTLTDFARALLAGVAG